MSAKAGAAIPITGSGTAFTGPGVYRGCALKSTSAGTLRIYDNVAASGTLVAIFELGAGAVALDDPSGGIYFSKGLHVAGPGVLEGSIRI